MAIASKFDYILGGRYEILLDAVLPAALSQYAGIQGEFITSAIEDNTAQLQYTSGTLRKLRMGVVSVPTNRTVTVVVRVNKSDSDLTFELTSDDNNTIVVDSTHSATFSTNQVLGIKISIDSSTDEPLILSFAALQIEISQSGGNIIRDYAAAGEETWVTISGKTVFVPILGPLCSFDNIDEANQKLDRSVTLKKLRIRVVQSTEEGDGEREVSLMKNSEPTSLVVGIPEKIHPPPGSMEETITELTTPVSFSTGDFACWRVEIPAMSANWSATFRNIIIQIAE